MGTPYSGRDEDIPTITTEDVPATTKKVQSNEIRIGPITRARAKLLEQQVNLFLNEPDLLIDENFILPKSLHLCMIRFEGDTAWDEELDMERNEELDMEAMKLDKERDMENKQLDLKIKLLGMKITPECAREEREAGAKEILKKSRAGAEPGPRPGIPSQGPT